MITDPETPFAFYSDRKLYLHNMAHAMCAWLGALLGDEFIWQSIGRAEVRQVVRDAMVEAACAVGAAHSRPVGPLLDHADDLAHRFANRALGDPVSRVGRDARRKLARGDRILGALELCREQRSPSGRIGLALAAGLRHLAWEENLDDAAVMRFAASQGFDLDDERGRLVREQYQLLADGFDASAHTDLLERRFERPLIP